MYILTSEGQKAFSIFMNTLVAQVAFGSISLVILYRVTKIAELNFSGFVLITIALSSFLYLIYWCYCSFMEFIKPLTAQLDSKVRSIEVGIDEDTSLKTAVKIMIKKVEFCWKNDRKIFWQVITLFLALEIPAILLIFASLIGANQILETLKWF